MKKHITGILILVYIFLVYDNSSAIEFSNFSKKITLSQVQENYYLANNLVEVKISNRVIVQASSVISPDSLKKLDPRIIKIQEIYKLSKSIFYCVSLNSVEHLSEILHIFEKHPYVLRVQPDLLQTRRSLSSQSSSPSLSQQYYVKNLSLRSLWQKSRGKNVRIAIIDDGFQLHHEDLQKVSTAFLYDVNLQKLQAFPITELDTHGTKVTGIIFSQHNDIGIDGIAPEAELIAIRQTETWTSKTLLSFYKAKLAEADIINCSWNSKILLEPVSEVIGDLTVNGRGGLGTVVIFAAGNEGQDISGVRDETYLPEVITVGAVDRFGNRLKFSNYGKQVDIYTYGSDLRTTSANAQEYTSFSGTSASAAVVSGVSALMLSVNKTLPLHTLQQRLDNFFRSKTRIGDMGLQVTPTAIKGNE